MWIRIRDARYKAGENKGERIRGENPLIPWNIHLLPSLHPIPLENVMPQRRTMSKDQREK
jgi:hypothetical protein